MRSIAQIGLKIKAANREYYRYTGPSAELERRGAGTSRPELAWVQRLREQGRGQQPSSSITSGSGLR